MKKFLSISIFLYLLLVINVLNYIVSAKLNYRVNELEFLLINIPVSILMGCGAGFLGGIISNFINRR